MKIKFDRQEYLALGEIFEVGQIDDVTLELSEFSDDIEDMAYELAYTRYELAKTEARRNALVEAVAWERECDEFLKSKTYSFFVAWGYLQSARAEVDRLLSGDK